MLRAIEQTTKRKMDRMKEPTLDEAIEGQQQVTVDRLRTIISENNLNFYMTAAAELLEDHDSVTVVAAAIKMMTKEPDATPVRLTDEAPMISKRHRNNRSSSKRRDGGGGGGYRGKGKNSRSSYGDKSVLQMTAIVLLTIVVKRNLITTNIQERILCRVRFLKLKLLGFVT